MGRPRKRPIDDWEQLALFIQEYRDAAIAHAEKGGGDPNDIPAINAELTKAKARLEYQLGKMKSEYKRV